MCRFSSQFFVDNQNLYSPQCDTRLFVVYTGLIIDSFGELRDKEETLTNEMQTKCFVCGLPKNEFDHIPHGFDNHTAREHNMAHYM